MKQFERIELEIVDEYSIGVAKMALKHTDIPVYATDKRIQWFIGESDRLHIVDSLPAENDKRNLRL